MVKVNTIADADRIIDCCSVMQDANRCICGFAYGKKHFTCTDIANKAAYAVGTDITGIELSLAGYNRSPRSVMRDLKLVSNGQEKPTFWTLVKNKDKFDEWFQGENINYVPRFYAAAIIGENPTDFGIEMKPLSTYTKAIK